MKVVFFKVFYKLVYFFFSNRFLQALFIRIINLYLQFVQCIKEFEFVCCVSKEGIILYYRKLMEI